MTATARQTNAMSNSALMRAKIRLTCSAADEAFAAFWAREDLGRVVPAFLVLLQQIMRTAVPLLEMARDRAAERAADDPVCGPLAEYYAKHAVEERDHDQWTLDDLEAVGYPRRAVLDMVPLPDVASMVGAQYYWVNHHHPVMLLGWLAVLEGGPPTEALIRHLETESGLPAEAFRTYRFHGEVDPHHLEDLDRALDAMPLERNHMGLIGISATHTANRLAACIRGLDPSDAPERLA